MAGGKFQKSKLRIIERRQKAIALRRAGATYRAIAQRLSAELGLPKYDASQAFDDVAAALDESISLTQLEAEALRQLENERLDQALLAIAPLVQQGHLGAIDRWIRISERRSRLLGLDSPITLQVEQQVESELEQILDRLESVLPAAVYRQVLEAIATIENRAGAAERN